MEGFNYQHYQPFLLDQSVICPDTPIEMPLLTQQVEATNPSYYPYYYSSKLSNDTEISAAYESSSSFDSCCMMAPSGEGQMRFSSLLAEPQGGQEPPTPQVSLEKKRKNSNETPLSSGQSKGTKETKSKKQKQNSEDSKGTDKNKQKADDDMKKATTKAREESPAAYIHVRARRGQATDSHSLAERVRREKITEKMKMLQGLVPGCEKVTGKAFVLDEIINYVQSLQNQVEFLSMKLASFNPVLYDLGGEEYDDGCMSQQEKMGRMQEPLPSEIQSTPTQPTAFENAANNYPMIDYSSSYLLHEQGHITFTQHSG